MRAPGDARAAPSGIFPRFSRHVISTRLHVHSQRANDSPAPNAGGDGCKTGGSAAGRAELADGVKDAAVNDVGLERMEERLHVRVLARAPPRVMLWRTPRPSDTRATACPETRCRDRCERSGRRPAGATQRRVQRPRGSRANPGAAESPRQDPPRVVIHHNDEIPPPAADREIRQIADPDLIRSRRLRPTQ